MADDDPDVIDLDLAAISARWNLARMAGEDADDAGNGWDEGKIRAVIQSWQDVFPLYRAVVAMTDTPTPGRHRAEGVKPRVR